jgi:hypothetical protein
MLVWIIAHQNQPYKIIIQTSYLKRQTDKHIAEPIDHHDKIVFITDFGIKNEPHTHRKP